MNTPTNTTMFWMKRNVGLILAFAGLLAPHMTVAADNSMAISEELDAQYTYVGGAATRGAGPHVGSVSEHSADVKYVFSPQVTKDVLLRFGCEWQRFSFDVPGDAPIPDTLQQVSAVIGLDYQLGDQWLVRAELEPGMYGDFENSTFRDFNAPLVLGAAYLADADLQWFFGLRVDLRSNYPVLPAPGVRWKFADEWTLNLDSQTRAGIRCERPPSSLHGGERRVGNLRGGRQFRQRPWCAEVESRHPGLFRCPVGRLFMESSAQPDRGGERRNDAPPAVRFL